jgi:hypothetical protein
MLARLHVCLFDESKPNYSQPPSDANQTASRTGAKNSKKNKDTPEKPQTHYLSVLPGTYLIS